jgi:hypothetical protein
LRGRPCVHVLWRMNQCVANAKYGYACYISIVYQNVRWCITHHTQKQPRLVRHQVGEAWHKHLGGNSGGGSAWSDAVKTPDPSHITRMNPISMMSDCKTWPKILLMGLVTAFEDMMLAG